MGAFCVALRKTLGLLGHLEILVPLVLPDFLCFLAPQVRLKWELIKKISIILCVFPLPNILQFSPYIMTYFLRA